MVYHPFALIYTDIKGSLKFQIFQGHGGMYLSLMIASVFLLKFYICEQCVYNFSQNGKQQFGIQNKTTSHNGREYFN